jgi:transposase
VQARIRLNKATRQELQGRFNRAVATGSKQLVKRIGALLFLDQGLSVAQVAEAIEMGAQTVRDAVRAYLLEGAAGLGSERRPGRPPRLTKTQRKELGTLIESGPEACGYPSGCWSGTMIAHLIQERFGIVYHPHYVCQLLHNLGFSYQKARFVSDHLNELARKEWKEELWPKIVALAKKKKARILFGDEASFAQWGSLSYTWAPKGQQPTVKTSGVRRGYKVFGLIDLKSGDFLFKGQEGRFNSESYELFLSEVLETTPGHIILVHDRVRYHTSAAMQAFYAKEADRLSVFELPAYSPDFNPIEFLWKKVKKRGTHLRYFPDFQKLVESVESALYHFAGTPAEIKAVVGQYCESLGELAA